MLSYLLQDKEVSGIHTSERFLAKVADDPELQQEIKKTATGHTDAILFNIDIEGPSDKTKTAVLRVFAKMFYNHLGFYGEDSRQPDWSSSSVSRANGRNSSRYSRRSMAQAGRSRATSSASLRTTSLKSSSASSA